MNSQQLSVIGVLVGVVLIFSGCEGFRYAATEAQKENAWLHMQVCGMAADAAVEESASQTLCDLTALAREQSTAFVMDYGLPTVARHGQAEFDRGTLENPLPPSGYSPLAGGEFEDSDAGSFGHNGEQFKTVLSQAKADSMQKPDVFGLADGLMELGIALAGLVGGVYGIRIAGYLKQAREKSRALKEIVEGNELFKQLWPEQAQRFKEAQQKQSAATKQIVTQLKTG